VKCAWWVIVGKHPPRPCWAQAVGKRQDVRSCKKHLRGPLPAVAVVAETIRRTLEDIPLSAEMRVNLLVRLVKALETPL